MRRGLSLGRLFGIEIRIDWSWLFIFLLIVWNLSASFSQTNPDWNYFTVQLTAIAGALLFFASVLLHELAHSLMAMRQGMLVRHITLFLFGGVSNIQREPPSPKAEFLITIVGPLTSFLLGALFLLIANFRINIGQAAQNVSATMADMTPLVTMVLWLGSINIILAIFNLIPGFPLDGGRILRAVLWGYTDDLTKATRWASWAGQTVAWLFIASGIAMIFGVNVPFFGTGAIGGLWIAFIGWFLNSAAISSYQRVVVNDVLEDVPVKSVMRVTPPTVAPEIPVDSFVHDYVMQTDDYAFPVVDGETLFGLVTLTDVRATDRDRWHEMAVRDIMTPLDQLVTLEPEDDTATALRTLIEKDYRQLPVVHQGILVGLLRRRDIMRWLKLQTDIQDGMLPGRRALGQSE